MARAVGQIIGLFLVVVVLLAANPQPVAAQDFTSLDAPQDEDYARAIRFRGLQSRLTYVDQLHGKIPMDRALQRWTPATADDKPLIGDGVPKWLARLALMALICVGAFALYRRLSGLRSGLSLKDGGDGRRTDGPGGWVDADGKTPSTAALLDRLRQHQPREEALVVLIGHTLDAAAQQHALRIGRSETAREFLHRLPVTWTRLSDLRRIVMTEELVQFGGRPLPDKTFEDCLRRAEPILAGAFR